MPDFLNVAGLALAAAVWTLGCLLAGYFCGRVRRAEYIMGDSSTVNIHHPPAVEQPPAMTDDDLDKLETSLRDFTDPDDVPMPSNWSLGDGAVRQTGRNSEKD